MPVISVENLSKSYRLGQIGTGTLARDLSVWWARARGKPNPLLKIGQEDRGNRDGETIWALKDVSFSVEQGEVLGVIGRNGAGKSTLLKVLSRVTAPTSGRVKVKGRIASLLEVGTGFHPELTGRENVYLNGAILGMTREEVTRKFDEIVDFSGVEQFIDTPVKRYSSGMYVRLAFAVAAHLEPEILLVDEVLAVGDAEFQKKCLGKMDEVAHEGRTVLFVSHNMAAVAQLCKNGALLQDGTLKALGPVDPVIKQYLSNDENSRSNDAVRKLSNQRFAVTDAYILNKDGERVTSPVAGEEMEIVIAYRSQETLSNAVAMITIYNHQNIAVAHLNSKSGGRGGKIQAGEGKLVCRIPHLPLPNSTYRVAAALDCEYGQIYHSPVVLNFQVEVSKFYSTAYLPPSQYSAVLMEHEWIFS